MSRFYQAGRRALYNAAYAGRSHMQRGGNSSNRSRHIITSSNQQFSITFTAAADVMRGGGYSQSTVIGASNHAVTNGGWNTSVRNSSTTTTMTSNVNGAAGCGAAQCCQTALSAGEDGEDPFIGAPSLSIQSHNNQSTNEEDVREGESHSHTSTSGCNNQHPSTHSRAQLSDAAVPAATPATTPSAPTPRVKCDPFEQGGHPLADAVVLQYIGPTLDSSWQYDSSKKLLVRSFEFRRMMMGYLGAAATQGRDVIELFSFVAALGRMSVSLQNSGHSIYNLNLNLRANSLQVMLKTVPLKGASYRDLQLATEIDGMWFRLEGKIRQMAEKMDNSKETNQSMDE